MKKMIFLGCLVLFFSTIVSAQEKIGAPVWNVGDKWVFTRGDTMEIIDADQNSYVAKLSGGMFQNQIARSYLRNQLLTEFIPLMEVSVKSMIGVGGEFYISH